MPLPSGSVRRGMRRGFRPSSRASNSRGTPGRMWMLPLTTEMGTHRSSGPKRT